MNIIAKYSSGLNERSGYCKSWESCCRGKKGEWFYLLLIDCMESYYEACVGRLFWRATSSFVNPISTRQRFTILGHSKFFRISSLMWSITRRQPYPILDLLNLLKVRLSSLISLCWRIMDFVKKLANLLNPDSVVEERESNLIWAHNFHFCEKFCAIPS